MTLISAKPLPETEQHVLDLANKLLRHLDGIQHDYTAGEVYAGAILMAATLNKLYGVDAPSALMSFSAALKDVETAVILEPPPARGN